MPQSYEQNKIHILNYYNKNKDKVNEYKKDYYRNLYDTDIDFKTNKLKASRNRYHLKKEMEIFRNILYI
jgi:hypothetical protein